ncbi:hypothetical protein FWK35_00038778 [Aphis craccivora]|uniref:Uncharacterized protein n=1 Tax=Aphis craccivora TaxID=307492 RepID=A0A6G0Y8V5_APHCR|nr:hypothetical protein FWK35_00038778 [Aphis craccivora]
MPVYTRTCRNNVPIFNISSFSGIKVNLVGALGRSFFEFRNIIMAVTLL